jgi:acyl-CoA thioester hydrolase
MNRDSAIGVAPSMGWWEADVHVLPLRVYYEDTDAGGIVYHASYLRFLERARTEMLRSLGLRHGALWVGGGVPVAFAVRACSIDFLRPARLDDVLDIRTQIEEMRGASIALCQAVVRRTEEIARAMVRVACIDAEGRPRRLPRAVREAFLARPGAGEIRA